MAIKADEQFVSMAMPKTLVAAAEAVAEKAGVSRSAILRACIEHGVLSSPDTIVSIINTGTP